MVRSKSGIITICWNVFQIHRAGDRIIWALDSRSEQALFFIFKTLFNKRLDTYTNQTNNAMVMKCFLIFLATHYAFQV